MSDNTFIPVPLPGDPIQKPKVDIVDEVIIPLEGIQDTGSRKEDYVSEREQYLKRFKELIDGGYPIVSEYVQLMIRDLDSYVRKELTIEQVSNNSKELKEYYLEMDDENYPNREVIVAYNYIRNKLLDLYTQDFGDK